MKQLSYLKTIIMDKFDKEFTYIEIGHFMNQRGYSFDMDDGFWFEDYCQDHKWKEIFDLMIEWRDECENVRRFMMMIILINKRR